MEATMKKIPSCVSHGVPHPPGADSTSVPWWDRTAAGREGSRWSGRDWKPWLFWKWGEQFNTQIKWLVGIGFKSDDQWWSMNFFFGCPIFRCTNQPFFCCKHGDCPVAKWWGFRQQTMRCDEDTGVTMRKGHLCINHINYIKHIKTY